MRDKIMKTAERYLNHVGYEIVHGYFESKNIIVAFIDNRLSFIHVFMPDEQKIPMKREDFEDMIHAFFVINDEFVDMEITYDMMSFDVVRDDRAIIKHHVNASLED